MSTVASQITSLTIVYLTVYLGVDQRKHQISVSLALCGKFTGDRWIPRAKGQQCGKCFHLMASPWFTKSHECRVNQPIFSPEKLVWSCTCFTNHYLNYSDVIMRAMASQITGIAIVCSAVCPAADQRKHLKLRFTGLCVSGGSTYDWWVPRSNGQ